MLARLWFALTALVVLVGLAVQIAVTAGATGGHFPTVSSRLLNLLCFFTIQSNIIVGATSLLLAIRPDRTSTLFRVLRLDGIVAITVTFVVFRIALADLHDLTGSAAFADFMLHVAAPVLCVLGWLAFGPRPDGGARLVLLSAIFPVAYLALTLVRGPVVDFYPYPFLDVGERGYGRVLLNSVIVGVLFLAVTAAVVAVDGWLRRRQTGDSTDALTVTDRER
jgi:hypothetical protein